MAFSMCINHNACDFGFQFVSFMFQCFIFSSRYSESVCVFSFLLILAVLPLLFDVVCAVFLRSSLFLSKVFDLYF